MKSLLQALVAVCVMSMASGVGALPLIVGDRVEAAATGHRLAWDLRHYGFGHRRDKVFRMSKNAVTS